MKPLDYAARWFVFRSSFGVFFPFIIKIRSHFSLISDIVMLLLILFEVGNGVDEHTINTQSSSLRLVEPVDLIYEYYEEEAGNLHPSLSEGWRGGGGRIYKRCKYEQ